MDAAYLVEGTLVPVFLQELLLSFGLLVSCLVRMLQILFETQLLRHRASPLDFLFLLFAANDRLLVAFDSRELSDAPRLKVALGVEAIGIVDVGYDVGRLLCSVMSGES